MISRFGKYIPVIFLITCAFVFLDSLISFDELHNIENDQQMVVHTYQVIHQSDSVVKEIIKEESDQRNFLLLQNNFYLQSYKNGWITIENEVKKLKSLTSDNPSQLVRIKNLQQKAEEEKSLLNESITISQNQDIYTAQNFITLHNGRQILSAITNDGNAIVNEENTLLEKRKAGFAISAFHMYTTIILSAILNIFLLLIAYIVIMREFRQRSILEQKKNEFISLASHELKTPITTMSIFSELLSKRLTKMKDRKTHHILGRMHNQIGEMNNLIDDLLDVTRIQLGKLELHKEKIYLNDIIKETVEDIQATTKKHKIHIRRGKKVSVYADRQRIWQVLSNLLNNAVKYSPKGGKIEVSIKGSLTRVTVRIRDYGIGINKENQERIFDRYFREEGNNQKQFSGLGLGLYLTQQILQLHRGTIWVKSIPGKGSTFSFTLPMLRIRKRNYSVPSDHEER